MAEAGRGDAAWREAESFYRAALERHHVVGSSLMIVRDGKLAHHAVYGLARP